MILLLNSHLVTCTTPRVLLDTMLHALILFFYMLCVAYIYYTKFNMTDSFKIIIVKIIIIKINITKFYTIKVYIITKECNSIRVYIPKKIYIIIRKTALSIFSREFLHIFWTTWGNSIQMFPDDIKNHKKPGFHSLFRRYIFWKTTGGINLTPQGILGLTNRELADKYQRLYHTFLESYIYRKKILT